VRPSTVSAIGRTAIRLAWEFIRPGDCGTVVAAYIFDIWTRVDSDHIAVFDTEIVSHNTVDTRATVIQVIIGQDDQDGISSLLAFDEDCVATEEL
jgi:hypothetical protein